MSGPVADVHQGQHHVPVGPGDRGADDLVGPEDPFQHHEQVAYDAYLD